MMHFYSSIFYALLLSIHFAASVNAGSCTTDEQCEVSKKLCAMCTQGKGPACTTAICLDNKCHQIQACSLQLSGSCSSDGRCVTNYLCMACKNNTGPTCTTAKCLNKQCALFAPCSVNLKK